MHNTFKDSKNLQRKKSLPKKVERQLKALKIVAFVATSRFLKKKTNTEVIVL